MHGQQLSGVLSRAAQIVDYRWRAANNWFFLKLCLYLTTRDRGFLWHTIQVPTSNGASFWRDFVL